MVIYFFGGIFILIGIVIQIKHLIKNKFSNYEETLGEVVDYKESWDTDSDGSSTLSYFPIIEYEVNGHKYRYVSHTSNNSKNKFGKEIEMKYDPNNPMKAIIKNDFTGLIFIITGIIINIIVYFVFMK